MGVGLEELRRSLTLLAASARRAHRDTGAKVLRRLEPV